MIKWRKQKARRSMSLPGNLKLGLIQRARMTGVRPTVKIWMMMKIRGGSKECYRSGLRTKEWKNHLKQLEWRADENEETNEPVNILSDVSDLEEEGE
jgi:hypothetical protein